MGITDDKIKDLKAREAKLLKLGEEKAVAQHKEKGKLTARERLNLLFDPGTFRELYMFVGHRCSNFGMEKVEIPSDGVVTGHGQVDGRPVFGDAMRDFDARGFRLAIEAIKGQALKNDDFKKTAITALTLLNDRRYDTGSIKRSSVQHDLGTALDEILDATPMIAEGAPSRFSRIDFATRGALRSPQQGNHTLVIDGERFEPEGDNCDALTIVRACKLGWRRFILYRCRGQRFTGCGCVRPLGACASTSTARRATIWHRVSTGWRSSSMATPRTSSVRS